MTYSQRAKRVLQRIDELAAISENKNCIARTYGTRAFVAARNRVEHWMKEAGLHTMVDNIGNIRGRLLSAAPGAKTFVIASHIDTVINAGKFDGILGVLAGLEVLEQIIQSKDQLPFHIELIGFCDEEGCRFHTAYLGSKAIAGSFDADILSMRDAGGISLGEVIRQNGGDLRALDRDIIAGKDWLGYLEIHIEQGPVLFEKKIPVGLVTAIAGQYRKSIHFYGEAGHAGTVPMDMRKDALACAAEFILETEKFARHHQEGLMATIGKLHIPHAAGNVIPGEVICSLDLRSAKEETLLFAWQALKKIAEEICQKRNCSTQWDTVQQSHPVNCDAGMNEILASSIRESGYELVELISGAGHDAVAIAPVSPVAMLFVKCFKGISHHPAENVDVEDIAASIKVSDNFIQKFINTHTSKIA
jgi:hydantoinase/carbamoylase family amidase